MAKFIVNLCATVLFTAFGFLEYSQAQPSASVCDNLSNLGSHYKGEYGKWRVRNGAVQITQIFYGLNPNHHVTRYPSDGNLARPNPNKSPYVAISATPPGSSSAIQLGNLDNGKEWERLSVSIPIGHDNTLLLVKFAVVMQDPGHSAIDQPKFEFKALDPNGQPLP